jgi:hypothetical protein
MLNAALERAVIALTHDDVHMIRVVVEERRRSQRREISSRRVRTLPLFRWKENERLSGLEPSTLPLLLHTRGLSGRASQIKTLEHEQPPGREYTARECPTTSDLLRGEPHTLAKIFHRPTTTTSPMRRDAAPYSNLY